MSITATRRIEWCSGHRVLGHQGRCRHLHGHTYLAEITIEAPQLDPLGMVFDFGSIKQIVGGWVNENFDHNLLLNSDDPQLLHLLSTEERKPYTFEHRNPTAEMIAEELFRQCLLLLPTCIRVSNVRIWETPACFVDFSS